MTTKDTQNLVARMDELHQELKELNDLVTHLDQEANRKRGKRMEVMAELRQVSSRILWESGIRNWLEDRDYLSGPEPF
jgi:chromosome segregation ATPase